MSLLEVLAPFDPPRWDRDGQDWPNRSASRFVDVPGARFHVQVLGTGPVLLLLHGAGASTHSFRDFAPELASRFTVVAPDLPGHGFTRVDVGQGLGLGDMAGSVRRLVDALELEPVVAVGHSAGAAILARMTLDRAIVPRLLVGLNAALLPLRGVAGRFFAPAARLASRNPIAPRLAAWSATDRDRIARTLEGTGSRIDARGIDLYQRLACRSGHVAGTVGMMAAWDLEPLARSLPNLTTPLVLVVGEKDRAIPPADADRVAATVPNARVLRMAGLGHLAHEEAPRKSAALILQLAESFGILS